MEVILFRVCCNYKFAHTYIQNLNCTHHVYTFNFTSTLFCNRACVDTSEEGNLETGVFLGEYSATREFAPLTQEDQLNISINIHDEGNTLEIVSLCCK